MTKAQRERLLHTLYVPCVNVRELNFSYNNLSLASPAHPPLLLRWIILFLDYLVITTTAQQPF